MLKIKNKFIIFIIMTIIGIVLTLFLSSYLEKNKNVYSYVVLINGEAKLNENSLFVKEKTKLTVGDMVQTIGNDSLVVLEWGEGSVTRLGGNSSIKISELHISSDLSQININFNLLSGKSWSNIVSFFGENSYFKQYFRDSEAAVRGTVFNVDLENDYLYVTNHKIDLTTSNGEKLIINEQEPFDIKTFSFIKLENFIKSIKDKSFEEINKQFDKELILNLRYRLEKDLKSINKLVNIDIKQALTDDVKKTELYNKFLYDYQKLNFVQSSDVDLFKLKLEIKDKLLQLSQGENKDILINSTLFDFKEIIDSKNYESLDKLLNILSDNKEVLNKFNLNDYLNKSIIPVDIQNRISDEFGLLKNFFGSSINTLKNINIDVEDLKNIQQKADEKGKQILDKISNKLINN
ncbi:MAG: FecR domain-containing protein [Candidatus Gracilibacteria bacterium]|nr:FecR domain-containing protein [Candidatus Gracilibacteria bacterium]